MTIPRKTKQDKTDDEQRKKSLKKTGKAVGRLLGEVTRDGFDRLTNISDEDWTAAMDADAGEE